MSAGSPAQAGVPRGGEAAAGSACHHVSQESPPPPSLTVEERPLLVTARLRPPDRTVEVADVRRVSDLLTRLEVLPSTVLVIRGDDLLTSEDELHDGDRVEVRFAISGGA